MSANTVQTAMRMIGAFDAFVAAGAVCHELTFPVVCWKLAGAIPPCETAPGIPWFGGPPNEGEERAIASALDAAPCMAFCDGFEGATNCGPVIKPGPVIAPPG